MINGDGLQAICTEARAYEFTGEGVDSERDESIIRTFFWFYFLHIISSQTSQVKSSLLNTLASEGWIDAYTKTI